MKYDGTNLQEVLEDHKKWTFDNGGSSADLSGSDLSWANLERVDLREANLTRANLKGADLTGADLRGADLTRADLRLAHLTRADLRMGLLAAVDLRASDLREANFTKAYLAGADLTGSDLRNADFREANLKRAELARVDLRGALGLPFIPMACPDTGSFVGWKKCRDDIIVKLLIPEDAKRCSGTSSKCRCDKAVVLDIQNINGKSLKGIEACSQHDIGFKYTIGETVVPREPFNYDRFNECSSGIHFFINRQEAVNY